MKIAICDDEKIQRDWLYTKVNEYIKDRQLAATIQLYESSDSLFFQYDQNSDIDIVLLDIQMSGMNGMELAKKLREVNDHISIIFVTGVTDYIYDSFTVNAINYLLKPIKEDQLFSCLDKAVDLSKTQDKVLTFSFQKETVRLNVNDIFHIYSEGHYVNIVTEKMVYRIKSNLKDIENDLPAIQFYRIDRSNLVNLAAIEKITSKEIILINQSKILVPKGKYKAISQAFISYHFV